MTISTRDFPLTESEQINNRETKTRSEISGIDFNLDVAQTLYHGVKSILEKDAYNIFSTKSKVLYDKRIKDASSKIDSYIKLNQKGKQAVVGLKQKVAKLKKENLDAITELKEKLRWMYGKL